MRLRHAAIAIAILLPIAEKLPAQGIGTSPLYDHGIAGLATLQVETGIALDQSYHGSSAFRARWDWSRFAIGGAVGGAFGADRALLLALTPQMKVFNSCTECERRFVGGVFADGQRVHGGEAPSIMIGSLGLGASAQMDFVGFRRMCPVRCVAECMRSVMRTRAGPSGVRRSVRQSEYRCRSSCC